MSAQDVQRRVTLPQLQARPRDGEKLVMLTSYDASFARVCDEAGVDMLLVGDSLGMVIQGHDSTLPVTLEQVEYHVQCVARGSSRALVIADMPFGSFQESPQQAMRSCAHSLREHCQTRWKSSYTACRGSGSGDRSSPATLPSPSSAACTSHRAPS